MFWRTIAIPLAIIAPAFASEPNSKTPKWEFVRLVDAPLAPPDKPANGKIVSLFPTSTLNQTQPETVRLVPEIAVDPLSSTSPKTWRVFVGGQVRRPGAFNVPRPLTALQAVLTAGGLKDAASSTEVVVLRYQKINEPPTSLRVDLASTLAGRSVNDLWLRSHDVVIVPKAGESTDADELARSLPPPILKAVRNRPEEVHQAETLTEGPVSTRNRSNPSN